jgi:hypothetical protein
VSKGVSEEIRNKLSYPGSVAINWNVNRKFRLYSTAWRRQPQFINDLMQDWLKGAGVIPIKRDTAAEPPPREIQHIVN